MKNEVRWILVPVRDGIGLTRAAMKTFLKQQVLGTVRVLVVDNASKDGTPEWLRSLYPQVVCLSQTTPKSVAQSWNIGLEAIFGSADAVLVCNNDVELRPDTYQELLKHGGGFVTAVGNSDPTCVNSQPILEAAPRPHPDFSCYLIRRWVWDKVGRFDENFKVAFCEDWDYHCRLHKAGVEAVCIDIPFYHVGSATIKSYSEEAAAALSMQAEANREYFKTKWGFAGGSKEYEEFFKASPTPPSDTSS